jgi:hypothetical protein
VAVWLVLIVPVVTLKAALVIPAGTRTLDGTVSTFAIAPVKETEIPPADAGPFRVTVQVVLELEARELAAQPKEEIFRGAARDRDRVAVLDVPAREAVMVALWAVVNCPAVAINVPLVNPAAMVSEAGVLTAPVAPSATFPPPDPTDPPRATVHVAVAPGFNAFGVQEIEFTGGTTLMVPPAGVTDRVSPAPVVPLAPLSTMLIGPAPETVPDTVATTPFAIALAFMPLVIQVCLPEPGTHFSVFPAEFKAAPAATETLDMPAG